MNPAKIISLAAAFFLASPAFGWGNEGHEVIALIALKHLTPTAKAQISRLFREGDGDAASGRTIAESMMQGAIWPDAIKSRPSTPLTIFDNLNVSNAEESHPLHYIDLSGNQYNAAADCPDSKCAVAAIARCREVLADAKQPVQSRLEAIKFLIHLVGDIHQPLHVGRKADKGGNEIQIVRFLNRRPAKGYTLHQAWDSLIIEKADSIPSRYADSLSEGITDSEKRVYSGQLDVIEWVAESHKLAIESAYVSVSGTPIKSGDSIDDAYYQRCLPVVEQQLQKAGIRLAAILNLLFAR